MKKTNSNINLSALLIVISLSVFGLAMATGDFSVGAEEAKSAGISPHPVDEDMHHFMEYVFEPNYKRLKAGMADAPKDRKTWKAIKGDSLTLAECANLLLMRVPDEDAGKWRTLSIAVRTHGSELYQAARKSDYTKARNAYVTMLHNCNACHKHFADGKHQLKP
jgi:hypothetical protein